MSQTLTSSMESPYRHVPTSPARQLLGEDAPRSVLNERHFTVMIGAVKGVARSRARHRKLRCCARRTRPGATRTHKDKPMHLTIIQVG